jgi:hypothetical protein
MLIVDADNNRDIQDGSALFVGDQVLIDISTTNKG